MASIWNAIGILMGFYNEFERDSKEIRKEIIKGFDKDSTWILQGIYKDSIGILYGFYKEFYAIPQGSYKELHGNYKGIP